MPIKVLIVGYGNVGKMALQALRQAKDMKLVGLASGSLSRKTRCRQSLRVFQSKRGRRILRAKRMWRSSVCLQEVYRSLPSAA